MRTVRLSISACFATTLYLAPALADDVTVFAAASLTEALDRIAAQWLDETGHRAVMSYAGSSALARQIQEGAPADIFISASADWMDEVAASGDIRAETRRDLLGNRLVLIAHGESRARHHRRDAGPARPAGRRQAVDGDGQQRARGHLRAAGADRTWACGTGSSR